MDQAFYKQALAKAFKDYAELVQQLHELNLRKAQLTETIRALNSLCSKPPSVNSLSLSDAIRLVFANSGQFMTPLEVRGRLKEFGYDLSKFKNPLASIHTALERMAEAEELSRGEDEDQKSFEAGDKLKKPPLEIEHSSIVETRSEKAETEDAK